LSVAERITLVQRSKQAPNAGFVWGSSSPLSGLPDDTRAQFQLALADEFDEPRIIRTWDVSRFITTPTRKWLEAKLRYCSTRFLIASPYVGAFLTWVAARLPSGVSSTLLTRTDLRDFALGASDIEALCDFAHQGATVLSLAGLHAKVYVLDNKAALVTSANATHSGMNRNWECGVAIDEPTEVQEVAELLLAGFGARTRLSSWNADEIEMLREPVRVLREQLPPVRKLATLEASQFPPIRLRRESKKALLKAFSGWTRLVLQGILTQKDTFFTLDQLAEVCGPLVAVQFPQNRFVREQLRKQLQRLRDLGLIEFLGGGNYRRTVNS
jgi:hypothetical protein